MSEFNSTGPVKSLPTRYAGCHFRSRLEARWAVFFDALNIEWQYEPEGFVGCYDKPYLPDFYLPNVHANEYGGVYVEVKGSDEALLADSSKIGEAIDWGATPVSGSGLIILGDVPRPLEFGEMALHSFLYHSKGVEHACGRFQKSTTGYGWQFVIAREIPQWFNGNTSEAVPDKATTQARIFTLKYRQGNETRGHAPPHELNNAYTAARSARFEHGQSGAS